VLLAKNYAQKKGMDMKLLFSAVISLFGTAAIAGDMSQCNSISDNDQRQMCRAQASRQVSECGFIQNNEFRYLCTAQVGKRPSDCGFIQNSNMRATCQATTR
jgi:hypothetical protein